MSIFDDARDAIRAWKADPALMVRQLFKVEPDRWQLQVLAAFPDRDPAKQRIAMQACAGPGKSTAEAWIGWNFMLCYSDGVNHPNGAAVSITADNLKNNLWKEFAVWRDRSPVLTRAFNMTAETIFECEHQKTWRLDARSFAKTANQEAAGRTLSGLHAKSILILVDESGDMPVSVGRTAEQALANCEFGKIVQAGNPTSHEGMLYQSVTEQSHLWHVVRINGDPDDPDRSPRVNLGWAKDQIQLHRRDNPWVMAFILGQFPPSSINALLGPDEVREAMHRQLRITDYDWSQKRLGIDVARFGDDRTVIQARQGLNAAIAPVVMRNARANAIAARVLAAKERWKSEMEFIDDTGTWGAGVVDNLITAGYSPHGIVFGAPAINPKYKNRRAEMWITMSEWIKRGGALRNIPELVKELTTPTYTFLNGQFVLEAKDQIKARLGRSPDMADALALTFALPDMPAGMMGIGGSVGHALTEFDPFANVG